MSNSDSYDAAALLDASIHQPQQARQQQPTLFTTQIRDQWKQQIGAAKIAWGGLTEAEILQTEGRHDKLTALLQERYALSRADAEDQVELFSKKCSR